MDFVVPPAEEIESTPFAFGNKEVIFTPKGWELCFRPEFSIALTGGLGSSKTHPGICRATRLSTWFPGNLGLIGRFASTDLAGTTRKDALDFWEEAGLLELFREKHPEYKVPTAVLRCVDPYTQAIIPNKFSEVIFVHLDDPEHAKGYHLGWGWIDEANQTKKAAHNMLVGRCRRPGFEGVYSVWETSNADRGKDWLWNHYFNPETLDALKPEVRAQRIGITTTTYENRRNLPPDYISNMESQYSEKLCRVLLGGSYESFEGQIFDEWDDQVHCFRMAECFPEGIPAEWNRLLAVDVGGSDPWAWEFAAVDPWGNVIFYDEIYGAGARVEPFARKAKPKIGDYRWQSKVIDYENKVAAAELAEHGITFTNAKKQNKNDSIFRMSGYLHPSKGHVFPSWHPKRGQPGSPRMFVSDQNKYLKNEIPQQRWRQLQGSEQFQNEMDPDTVKHSVDAGLYLLRELPRPTELTRTLISNLAPELDVRSRILHFEKRLAKQNEQRARFNGVFGHGRFGGMRPRRMN